MNISDSVLQLNRADAALAEQEVQEAQRKFRTTLSCWACDLLILQQAGLTVPSWRRAQNALRLSRAA